MYQQKRVRQPHKRSSRGASVSATLSVGSAWSVKSSFLMTPGTEDRAIWIADVLDSSEVDVKAWFDRSDLSEITMDSLKQAVEEAAMLITILDPSTFDSEWVQAENAWALAAGLPILAFYDADRYRWDEISHWRTEFPHVFKFQAIPHTKDFRSESRDRLLSAVCGCLGLEKTPAGKGRAQSTIALLPPQVPKLPEGYISRDAAVHDIIRFLLFDERTPTSATHIIVAVGMGGSGKSVTAAAVLRDREVRTMFDKICFVLLGQQPVVRDLYRQLHVQLCEGKPLDPSLVDDDACFHALQQACLGRSILLVLDDAWDKSHVEMFDCVDPASKSSVLVTARMSGIAVGAPEVQLGRTSGQ